MTKCQRNTRYIIPILSFVISFERGHFTLAGQYCFCFSKTALLLKLVTRECLKS